MTKIRVSRYRRVYGVSGELFSDAIGPNGCELISSNFVSCDIYDNSTLLSIEFPASENSGSFGLVLSSSLPVTYQSDGISWSIISGNGGGSLSLSTQVVNTSLTASSHNVLLVDASLGNITIGLPDAATSPSSFYHIKKTDDTYNSIFIDASGSQTVDGSIDRVEVDFPQDTIQVVNNGIDSWFVI